MKPDVRVARECAIATVALRNPAILQSSNAFMRKRKIMFVGRLRREPWTACCEP